MHRVGTDKHGLKFTPRGRRSILWTWKCRFRGRRSVLEPQSAVAGAALCERGSADFVAGPGQDFVNVEVQSSWPQRVSPSKFVDSATRPELWRIGWNPPKNGIGSSHTCLMIESLDQNRFPKPHDWPLWSPIGPIGPKQQPLPQSSAAIGPRMRRRSGWTRPRSRHRFLRRVFCSLGPIQGFGSHRHKNLRLGHHRGERRLSSHVNKTKGAVSFFFFFWDSGHERATWTLHGRHRIH